MNARTHGGRFSCAAAALCIGAFVIGLSSTHGLAAQAFVPSTEPVVELPPMIVAETSSGPPWLYVSTGDTEYLSRCSVTTTRTFIATQLEIDQLLHILVPAKFLATRAVPAVSVLMPLASKLANDDVVSREMFRTDAETRGPSPPHPEKGQPPPPPFRFLPNQRIDDRDISAIFTYLDEENFDSGQLIVTPDFLRSQLSRRTPMLPPWLIEGITELYQQASYRRGPFTLNPVEWISRGETIGLVRDPQARRVLLPASELFAFDVLSAPGNRNPARVTVWRAEVALFVRWALDPANAPARDGLWKLAERVSLQPMTEEIFTDCFGFGYADLGDRLSDYLTTAVKSPVILPAGKSPPRPRFEVVRAKPAQISRLRGEWERMEIQFVRENHPKFLARYVDRARTTLSSRVRETDSPDPQLLAALGLCELDAGNATAAQPWLDKALAAQVVRPRVYYEIARLRWEELIRGETETRAFSAEQLRPILDPLRHAIEQDPSMPEVYILAMDAWLHCRESPPAADLATFVNAAKLFRRVAGVSFRVALLLANQNRRAEAAAVLANGAEYLTEPDLRARYQQLQAALSVPVVPSKLAR